MFKRVVLAVLFAGLSSSAFAATGSLFDGMFTKHAHPGFGISAPVRASGALEITVDIAAQEMTVADEYDTVYTFDVSTGRKGHATPTGTFRPIRMHTMWHSSKYENAPMPYAIFFHGGYAIHGTTDLKHLGHAASHGCVRLDPANAKLLFDLVQSVGMENTKVVLLRG